MGTNYYLHNQQPEFEPIHIGKSSGGWYFSLHTYSDIILKKIAEKLPLRGNK
jgi:hypothetical protein